MLADEVPDMGYLGPQSLGGSPVAIVLYVDDVDARCAQAEREGATLLKPIVDEFFGDRSGTVTGSLRSHLDAVDTDREPHAGTDAAAFRSGASTR